MKIIVLIYLLFLTGFSVSKKTYRDYDWLTKDFALKLMQKIHFMEHLTIRKVQAEVLLTEGKNVASSVSRLRIGYARQSSGIDQATFILKTISADGNDWKEQKFKREVEICLNIAPEVDTIIKTLDSNHSSLVFPRCYDASFNPRYVILEDLSPHGYKNVPRAKGFDYYHMKATLKTLATWHAATATLISQGSINFASQSFKTPVWPESDFDKTLYSISQGVIDARKSIHLKDETVNKMNIVLNGKWKNTYARYITNRGPITVLTHGNLWGNNVVFSYDEHGQLSGTKIIEFSDSIVGSPAHDLAYILFSSSSPAVRERLWVKLIEYYHHELNTILIKLHYAKKLPTLQEIKQELVNIGPYDATMGIVMQYLRQLDGNYAALFDNNLVEHRQEREEILSDRIIAPTTKYLIEYFIRMGYYDALDE